MANKKLINCDQLQTAVEKVKEYVDTKDATKSNSSHVHGNITNTGGLSGKSAVVVTDASGLITSSSTISTTELGALDGISSNVQTQLDGKASSGHAHGNVSNTGTLGTASAVVVTDANKKITTSSSITTTELGYLDGVTSNVQTQLNNKASSGHVHGDITNSGTLPNASTVVIADANKKITNSTITTTELGHLSGVSGNIQTQLNNKAGSGHTHGNISNGGALSGKSMAVITDANGLITTSSTITTTELGYLDGVSSNVQNQINGKASSGHGHGNITNGGLLGTANAVVITDADKKITNSTVTSTELGHLSGVTSGIQGQLDGKAGSGHAHGNITNGGALGTANAVVVTDGNKYVTASTSITTTELGYLDGVTSNIQTQLGGKAPTSHASTGTSYGAANATNYGHAMASSTTPKVAGTAAVGSETAKFARGDHVHPAQTSVTGSSGSCTGNAATATKWKTARKLSWTGDATGEMSVDGSADVEGSLTLAASGVTAGSYGPSANASPAHAGTFSVPYITVDAKGRVTGASTKTITLPSDNNTDTKVTNTLNTTAKAYITGTTSATTNTGTQIFDTGVYLTTTAGELAATKFTGALNGNANTASTWATSRNFTIKDNDETNSGPSASVNGGGNVTLKLPATIKASITGNASTASKLAASKTINGTAFDGSGNITTANWGTSRTLTIGNKGQSVNGSGNVTWSLSDIGAFPAAGGTATGDIIVNKSGARFKVTNGTNTVWFGINGAGDKWGIYDETNAKYIVESNNSGSSFLGNATSATQAVKADQLTNNRTINGTNFNGTANITTANWGTARNITIGGTTKSVNGSAAYSWSLNEIGAAKGKTTSATTAATAGWYRIATSVAGVNRNMATFTIDATVSGKHSVTQLNAGICYGQAPCLVQLSHAEHSATGISKARIVYHTTYSGNYAYLEVYVPTATATTINVHMADYFGWSLVAPSTAGSVPSGYTNKELTLVKGGMAAHNIVTTDLSTTGTLQINTGTIKGKTSSELTAKDGTTKVASGTAVSLFQYNTSHNLHIGSGLMDNNIVTGSTYLTGANQVLIRTVASSIEMKPENTSVMSVSTSGVSAAKMLYAKAGLTMTGNIITSANGSHAIGSVANRFSGIYGANIYSYDKNEKHYASLRLQTEGTTSAQGVGRVVVGNNTNAGTAGNAKGQIVLYGTNTGNTVIEPGYNSTSSITVTLPSATGTLATTANVTDSLKDYLPLSGGTITGTLKVNSTLTTGANIVSDTAVTDSVGTSTVPWNHVYSRYFNLRANATGVTYGTIYVNTLGTTSATGLTRLTLGNDKASGTADNASSEMHMYGTNTGYTKIVPGHNSTGTKTITLPSDTGTLARTVDNVASATKVHTTLGTTTKAYLLATSTAPTSTSTAVNTIGDTGVFLTSTAGQVQLTSLIATSGLLPDTANGANMGTAALPWGTTYGKIFELYGAADAKYGSLRVQTAGTADTQGDTRLVLGNATNKGTANNARGTMLLYGTNTGYTYIVPGYNSTSSITITLPSAAGTLATTDNLDTKVANYLPLAGGNMTGAITFDNDKNILWKTAAAYTNSEDNSTIAAGTALSMLKYNGSGNLHIGAGINDKHIKTGNTYINAGVNMTLRTNDSAGTISLSPGESAKFVVTTDEVRSAVTFRPSTVATRHLGLAENPWCNTYSKSFYLYGTDKVQYGSLRTHTEGTTSATGDVRLYVGNSTASGTAGNARGRIVMYGTNTGYTWLTPGNNGTDAITVELPSGSGKIPLMVSDANNYWGLLPPTGSTDTWIRSGGSGFLPYDDTIASSLGGSSYVWNSAYVKTYNLYGEKSKTYGYMKVQTIGTTSATGEARLLLGNSIASGTASNSIGRIYLYGSGTGNTCLTPGNNTNSNITLTLPSAAGTIARTADNVASATKLNTARTLKLGATGKTFDGSANVTWTLNEIMDGQGLNYDTACNTLYFNNAGTSHKGRLSVYNNGTEDYVQLALRTADTTVNALHLYASKATIGLPLNVDGTITLNNAKDTDYQAYDAHRNCTSATDSSSSTYYPVSSYSYSTARFGCVNSFGGVAALETRHNGSTVGYIRVLPNGGIQLGSGKKLHIQASAPTANVVNGDVWIDI